MLVIFKLKHISSTITDDAFASIKWVVMESWDRVKSCCLGGVGHLPRTALNYSRLILSIIGHLKIEGIVTKFRHFVLVYMCQYENILLKYAKNICCRRYLLPRFVRLFDNQSSNITQIHAAFLSLSQIYTKMYSKLPWSNTWLTCTVPSLKLIVNIGEGSPLVRKGARKWYCRWVQHSYQNLLTLLRYWWRNCFVLVRHNIYSFPPG